MAWRETLRNVVDGDRFQRFIVGVIVLNAVTLGLETSERVVAELGWLLHAVDRIALAIFVVELGMRLAAHGWQFFRDPWSVFDFVVIGIALIPASEAFSVLRALRILRVLRLVALVPSMRGVVAALLTAVPGMASPSTSAPTPSPRQPSWTRCVPCAPRSPSCGTGPGHPRSEPPCNRNATVGSMRADLHHHGGRQVINWAGSQTRNAYANSSMHADDRRAAEYNWQTE